MQQTGFGRAENDKAVCMHDLDGGPAQGRGPRFDTIIDLLYASASCKTETYHNRPSQANRSEIGDGIDFDRSPMLSANVLLKHAGDLHIRHDFAA